CVSRAGHYSDGDWLSSCGVGTRSSSWIATCALSKGAIRDSFVLAAEKQENNHEPSCLRVHGVHGGGLRSNCGRRWWRRLLLQPQRRGLLQRRAVKRKLHL